MFKNLLTRECNKIGGKTPKGLMVPFSRMYIGPFSSVTVRGLLLWHILRPVFFASMGGGCYCFDTCIAVPRDWYRAQKLLKPENTTQEKNAPPGLGTENMKNIQIHFGVVFVVFRFSLRNFGAQPRVGDFQSVLFNIFDLFFLISFWGGSAVVMLSTRPAGPQHMHTARSCPKMLKLGTGAHL